MDIKEIRKGYERKSDEERELIFKILLKFMSLTDDQKSIALQKLKEIDVQ